MRTKDWSASVYSLEAFRKTGKSGGVAAEVTKRNLYVAFVFKTTPSPKVYL